MIKGIEIELGTEVREQLERYLEEKPYYEILTAINDDLVILVNKRSANTGCGMSYYDQLHVFFRGQRKMQEWRWRDGQSYSGDRPDLRIHGIGQTKIDENNGKTVMTIELKGPGGSKRSAIFEFKPVTTPNEKLFSEEEQRAFVESADTAFDKVMIRLKEGDTYKLDHYLSSRERSRSIYPKIGVATLLTEEQIDHLVSDRQMRVALFVFKADSGEARQITEDHGYGREGGAFLSIVEVEKDKIIVETKGGKMSFNL